LQDFKLLALDLILGYFFSIGNRGSLTQKIAQLL
jgi:hypothetical protein